jgi:integrase
MLPSIDCRGFVDIPEALAQVLRRYTEGKNGFLFTTRAGRVLDQRNSLNALHGAGNRGGFHAFRRFRFAVLREAGVPENLIKQWMGHSQNLMDIYAAQYGSTWPIVANGAR